MIFPLKKPSAWMPLAMSLAALALLLGYVAMIGLVSEAGFDEGAAAGLFQLLIICQAPIIAFHAIKWFPRSPRRTSIVLARQLTAALLPVVLVLVLESQNK